MYINISREKTLNFSIFTGMLVTALLLTFSLKNYFSAQYTRNAGTGFKVENLALAVKTDLAARFLGNDERGMAFSGLSGSKISKDPGPGDPVASDIPVLVYHGIVANPDRFSTTEKIFIEQMRALRKAGYYTITVDDFKQFMDGAKKLKDKAFLLTFDDGRTDSYTGADVVLQELGFNAVMFVATADSLPPHSNGYYLNTETLTKMVSSGRWEIGSHAVQENTKGGQIPIDKDGTLGNFLSNKMWLVDSGRLETDREYEARVTKELVQSKTDLEKTFGVNVMALSYPFSDYGQQTQNNPKAISVINKIMRENYSLAFQQTCPSESSNISNYADMDDYHLLRTESGTTWTGDYIVRLLATASTKPLPYSDTFAIDTGWRGTWGEKSISDNSLNLFSLDATTGSFAFLDGTREWRDYFYALRASLQKGTHVSLVSRFIDSNNNVACVFSVGIVRIEQKVNGVTTVMAHVPNPVSVPPDSIHFGMSVAGKVVKCFEGSRIVASTQRLSGKIDHGGIALQVWDTRTHNAFLSVYSLDAVSIGESVSLIQTMPNYKVKGVGTKR